MTYQNHIRKLRRKRKLSQAKLADLVGVKQYTISRYETDVSGVSAEMLEKIAAALGVSMSGFWRGAA